ncbi:MAG TPA: hypothetical protein GXZ69_07845, partial [Spirochaetales bacterium]|nr:hypothetical protein [Spirochaetales bacterium]
MRKHLILITTLVFFTLALPIKASSYPKLTTQYELDREEIVPLEQEALQAFIEEWQEESLPTFAQADQQLRNAQKKGNLNLEQLQSLYRMQADQLEYQKSEQGFKFGISSTPL